MVLSLDAEFLGNYVRVSVQSGNASFRTCAQIRGRETDRDIRLALKWHTLQYFRLDAITAH